MTSIAKLKDKARKHEQKENWQAAIEVYQKVLDKQDETENLELDLGLYNRIGDLNLRIGQTDEAVSYYEKAADKYAESGFYNNAIALCNKALRHRPDRAAIYLKLSRLCTEQGFQTDARRWILEYAERKVAAGAIEDALTGLEEFAELSEDPEVREMLAQQLASHGRGGEAIDQLRTAYAVRVQSGQRDRAASIAEKARAIDPDVDLEDEEPVPLPTLDSGDEIPELGGGAGSGVEESTGAPEEVEGGGVADELEATVAEVEEPVETEEVEGLEMGTGPGGEAGEAPEVEELEGLESTAAEVDVEEEVAGEVSGLEVSYGEREPAGGEEAEGGAVGGLETFDRGDGADAGLEEESREGAEGSQDFESEEEAEPLPLLDADYGDEEEPVEAGVAEEGPEGVEEELEAPEEEAEPIEPEPAEPVEVEAETPEEMAGAEAEVSEEPAGAPSPEAGAVEGESEIPVEPDAEEPEPVEGLEPEEVAAGEAALEAEEDEAAEEPEPAELNLSFEQGEPLPKDRDQVSEHLDVEGAFDLDEIDLGFTTGEEASAEGPIEDLDIEATLERARSLVSRALTDQALRELKLLSGVDAGSTVFEDALAVVNEILRHNPNDLEALRRRVEYAERIGDRQLQVDVHLDLAEALERTGSETRARVMYRRALELDPSNEVARKALGGEDEASEEEDEDAVDLNALVREMAPEGLEEAVSGSGTAGASDPEFAAMLDQFRAKVAESVDPEDADDHYDLGLAFKEMGLIDEAIAEFQTALTAGEERLKVYEELGQCFVQKGQYNVAVKVFERGLKVPHKEEDELLGVYYHLGQCYEELGQREEARVAYEKVLSIDPTFADVPDRVARL